MNLKGECVTVAKRGVGGGPTTSEPGEAALSLPKLREPVAYGTFLQIYQCL